jgi:hypothetical protein
MPLRSGQLIGRKISWPDSRCWKADGSAFDRECIRWESLKQIGIVCHLVFKRTWSNAWREARKGVETETALGTIKDCHQTVTLA